MEAEDKETFYIENTKQEAFLVVQQDGSLFFDGVLEDSKFSRESTFELFKQLESIFKPSN